MTGKPRPTHTSDAAADGERIKDPKAGLERTKEALKRILKVPKPSPQDAKGDGKR
jgi:hypothetical protein